MADDKLKKLREAAKKLVKDTSREDHKKPLSHQEQKYKEEHNQSVTDKKDKSGE